MSEMRRLREIIEIRKERRNAELRKKYMHARAHGFTANEAMILQHRSWAIIYKLAAELNDNGHED
jgi:hypothetical protein